MELNQELAQALDKIAPAYPVTIKEILVDLEGLGDCQELIAALDCHSPDHVVFDRIQAMELLDGCEYLEYGGEPGYGLFGYEETGRGSELGDL